MKQTKEYFFGHPRIQLPLEVVAAERGFGSFLTVDLTPSGKVTATSHRENIHIWIYLCDWEIFESDMSVLDSDETSDETYSVSLGKLVGLDLLGTSSEENDEACKIGFSNGFQNGD